MVDIKDIVPGAKFQIVDEWNDKCHQNMEGLMDKYLGTICTVKNVLNSGRSFSIFEDQNEEGWGGGWVWNAYCVNYYIDDSHMDKISISEEEFNAII